MSLRSLRATRAWRAALRGPAARDPEGATEREGGCPGRIVALDEPVVR